MISNFPNILGVATIVIMFVDYFISGGLTLGVPGGLAADVRSWLSTPVITWAVIVSTLRACLLYADNIRKRVENWWGYIIFFACFIGTIIAGFTLNLNLTYQQVYIVIYNGGVGAILGMMGFSFLTMFFRVYIANSKLRAWMILMGFIALFTITPIGDLLYPPLSQFGWWFIVNPYAGAYSSLWFITESCELIV